jgi:hypothetical protein
MYKMKSRLEELTTDKKEPEPQPTSIVWEPKKGDEYHFVGSDGTVQVTDWRGDQLDKELLKHHNVYKTHAQAVKAAPYQSRYNMALQAVLNLEPDQVVDWLDKSQKKYQVKFDHRYGCFSRLTCVQVDYGYPVLTDTKNVQPLLDYLNAKEKENG